MNSHDNSYTSRAAEAGRKRAAAKKLIEQYYFQLTQGCGNPQCDNQHCASNPFIQKLEPNEAAALAIRLLKAKAQLCIARNANGTALREGRFLNSRSSIHNASQGAHESVKGLDNTSSSRESHMDITNCGCNCSIIFPGVQQCLVADSNSPNGASSSLSPESAPVPCMLSNTQECAGAANSSEEASMDVSTSEPCVVNNPFEQRYLGNYFPPGNEAANGSAVNEPGFAPGSSCICRSLLQHSARDHDATSPEDEYLPMELSITAPDGAVDSSETGYVLPPFPGNSVPGSEAVFRVPDIMLNYPNTNSSAEESAQPQLSNSVTPAKASDCPSSVQEEDMPISEEHMNISDVNVQEGKSGDDLPPTPESAVPCNNSESVFSEPSTSASTSDSRGNKESNKGTLYLDESRLLSIIEDCRKEDKYSLLIRTLGQVFSSEDSLQHSFVKPRSLKDLCKEEIRAMEVDEDKDQDCKESEAGSSSESGLGRNCEITVDVESVRRAFKALFSIEDYPFQCALINALIILSENLEFDIRYGSRNLLDGNILNIFVIVMEIPMLECPEYMEAAFPAFCKAAALLPVPAQAKLATLWSTYDPYRLKEMVDTLHQFITLKVITGQFNRDFCINDDETVVAATKLMKILYYANMLGGVMETESPIAEETEQSEEPEDNNYQDLIQGAIGSESKEPKDVKEDALGQELGIKAIDCRSPVISFSEFYNEPLSDQIEMDRDFACYKTDGGKFSFMNYAFILTPAVKALGLYYDNRIRMYSERRISVLHSLVHGAPPNPYLKLRVRRDHLIDDALVGLEMVAMENPNNLKKQLVVEFEGEQGIDEGGVSKEFFQLVVEEVFNPDFAMFTLNPETQTYWFNPTSFESDGQFTLIGIILGLAIYNNIILDVHFPMVLYQKLMGKRGTSYDLQDWNPSLSKGLADLLAYEGEDIESVYLQTFRITYQDVFGTVLSHDLKENGDKIFVNQSNKKEFVELYASFLLNKAVEKQFRAFRRGFQMVTDDSPLKLLFRPEEIELLVCGSKNFDFNALEESTDYDGGYLADTPIIKWFWELVHEFSLEQKRKLLQFATGSDRVPVGGLSKLKLVIARHGPDSERLPTAHTCFNVLLLPEYSSKEKLEERLLKAINYSKGFGML